MIFIYRENQSGCVEYIGYVATQLDAEITTKQLQYEGTDDRYFWMIQ